MLEMQANYKDCLSLITPYRPWTILICLPANCSSVASSFPGSNTGLDVFVQPLAFDTSLQTEHIHRVRKKYINKTKSSKRKR